MTVAIRQQIESINDTVQQRRLETCLNWCRNLGRKLQPYFQVLDTYVQIQPEYLGIIWGTLRLIFKVNHRSCLSEPRLAYYPISLGRLTLA